MFNRNSSRTHEQQIKRDSRILWLAASVGTLLSVLIAVIL